MVNYFRLRLVFVLLECLQDVIGSCINLSIEVVISMNLFSIPAEHKRMRVNDFREQLMYVNFDLVKDEDIKVPEVYIIYKAGLALQSLSLLWGAIAYLIGCFHTYYDFWPELSIFITEPGVVGAVLALLNFSGVLLTLTLIPFFIIFAQHMDFRNRNLLKMIFHMHRRPNKVNETMDDLERVELFGIVLAVLIFLPLCMNASGVVFAFDAWDTAMHSPVIALCVGLFVVVAQAVCVHGFFSMYLLLAYLLYQRFTISQ